MDQTSDQIENQIQGKREDLKSNLQELESRVKSATDWRHYFREHTGAAIAVAFGGGMLLSAMLGKRAASPNAPAVSSAGASRLSTARHQAFNNFDAIAGALVGTAASKFKDVLGEVVPGFSQHLAETEMNRKRDATH